MSGFNSNHFKVLYKMLMVVADLYKIRMFKKYHEFFVSEILEINTCEGSFIFTIKHLDQRNSLPHYKFKMSLNVLDMSINEIEKYITDEIEANNKLFKSGIMDMSLSIIEEKEKIKPPSILNFWRYL